MISTRDGPYPLPLNPPIPAQGREANGAEIFCEITNFYERNINFMTESFDLIHFQLATIYLLLADLDSRLLAAHRRPTDSSWTPPRCINA